MQVHSKVSSNPLLIVFQDDAIFLLQIGFWKLTGDASIDRIQVKINEFVYDEILHWNIIIVLRNV